MPEILMNQNLMDPKLLMTLATVVIVTVAVIAVLYVGKRRNSTADLRKKFGPEYDRAVREQGSERKAEMKLADREKRVEKLNIRDLDPVQHDRFSTQWESVQSRFIDSPKGTVAEADDMVSSLMKVRGYPVSDFNQRAAVFLSTIPEWWRTTGPRMKLRCGLGKQEQLPKSLERR
jgi:hypothetical protein